jgi:hypothetical protein
MYDGPKRPSGEVALIETDGTVLSAVDGDATSASKVEVLPGAHALAVKLDDVHRQNAASTDGFRYFSDAPVVACFTARPGHAYQARPVYAGRRWRPEIIDETLAQTVRSWELDPGGRGCDAAGAGVAPR